MEPTDYILIGGLFLNLFITLWNFFELKHIEKYKANFDRTNRKISYIHQAIVAIYEKDNVILESIFQACNNANLDANIYAITNSRRYFQIRGTIEGVIPFLKVERQKEVIAEVDGFQEKLAETSEATSNYKDLEELRSLMKIELEDFVLLTETVTSLLQKELCELVNSD